MPVMQNVHEELAVQGYRDAAVRILQLNFPYISDAQLRRAVDYSIDKRFKNSKAVVKNNYKKTEDETNLLELTNFILSKEPIITPSGVMFSKHGDVPNPLVRMIESFLELRDVHKKEMFKYPKGSEMFTRFNLLQLLDKLDANGTYGAIGARTCIYFNLYVASSVTHQGMSAISAAALLFESFLSNNVGFSSLNDMVTFIRNVVDEAPTRKWDDLAVLDHIPTVQETFRKLFIGCGFGYIPTQIDMTIVWNMLQNLSPVDITRIYYKNNLYEFIDNHFVMDKIKDMLCKLKKPYVNPNKVPEEIKNELEEFWSLMGEYVYYDKQIIDRLGKLDNLIRNVSIIMDTDSSIVSLDAWYHAVLDKVYDVDMRIKHHIFSPFWEAKYDEFGDRTDLICPFYEVSPPLTYDLYKDEIVEAAVSANRNEIIPQDGLRYSIINIMAYCMTQMINDFMYKYVVNSHAIHPTKGCLFIMKNEFLFKRALDTDGKKNYCTIQELQEGNQIPKDKQLDIKGMPIDKVGLQPTIKAKLQKVLRDYILEAPEVNQMDVLKQLAIIEKEIYTSIMNGDREYYKPVVVKAQSSYDNPMRIQGIKASLIYNALKDDDKEPIDLTKRNSLDIIKCDITMKNVIKIANDFPQTYEKMVALLNNPEYGKNCIDVIGLPLNEEVPKWILPFVTYKEIINDNMKNFPLQYIGLSQTQNDSVNYTNIISI